MAAGGAAGFATGGTMGIAIGLSEAAHFGALGGVVIADAAASGAIAGGIVGAALGGVVGIGIAIYLDRHPHHDGLNVFRCAIRLVANWLWNRRSRILVSFRAGSWLPVLRDGGAI
jgi:hypothetical protein